MLPAVMVVADGAFVTTMSASVAAATVVLDVAELFVLTGSVVLDVTLRVS